LAQYAIGDLQGCYDPFRRLLDKLAFDPAKDRLWLTGDLVNRGPESGKTLRFVRRLGDAAITVLGNHDLHLLAIANDIKPTNRQDNSLRKILVEDDGAELIDWLRKQPLLQPETEYADGACRNPATMDGEEDTAAGQRS